jgi:hypothetical protein
VPAVAFEKTSIASLAVLTSARLEASTRGTLSPRMIFLRNSFKAVSWACSPASVMPVMSTAVTRASVAALIISSFLLCLVK